MDENPVQNIEVDDGSIHQEAKSEVQAENESKSKEEDWLDILGTGQLRKKVIKEGQKDSRPHRGYICHVKLEAKLENGTVVEKDDDMEIQLGDAEVIQGLDLAVPLMNVGEEALVEVYPRFGYGKLGRTPDIPASATLFYTVELLSAEPEQELEELTVSERKIIGNRKRERGNWWYQRDEHSLAIQCYRKALEYLDEAEGGITMESAENPEGNSPDLLLLIEDRLKVYNNLAAAQMKIKAFDAALQSVENVLRCQPKNVKALFRKGKILAEKGDTEQAVEVLRVANKLEPENKVIHQELGRVVARSKQDRSEEKNLYRRMLGQETPSSAPSDAVDNTSSFRLPWGVVVGGIVALVVGVTVMYRPPK